MFRIENEENDDKSIHIEYTQTKKEKNYDIRCERSLWLCKILKGRSE